VDAKVIPQTHSNIVNRIDPDHSNEHQIMGERPTKTRSTSFIFEYQTPTSHPETLKIPELVPRDYSEFMSFIKGRRLFHQLHNPNQA